ncbi:MAG: dephospho-CoA kinase [Chloroflexi bacterium]|nr:dephospho-CoA kinase [Chloroflexota bacterium]
MAFGSEVREENGRINRKKLGEIVFNDPAALRDLETMVHPAVRQVVAQRIQESEAAVVVMEAIKLLEGELAQACHQIWVTRCTKQRQLQRLMICRGWDAETSTMRVKAQPPQEEKVALADVVIDTDGLMTETEAQFACRLETAAGSAACGSEIPGSGRRWRRLDAGSAPGREG